MFVENVKNCQFILVTATYKFQPKFFKIPGTAGKATHGCINKLC